MKFELKICIPATRALGTFVPAFVYLHSFVFELGAHMGHIGRQTNGRSP